MTDLLSRYERAESVLLHKLRDLIDVPRVNAVWIKDTDTFWYRKTVKGASEFVLVDAAAGTKQPAFDHDRMAKALSTLKGEEFEAGKLPIFSIDFTADNKLRFGVLLDQIEVDLVTYEATIVGQVNTTEALSPDGKWGVSKRDFNLVLRNVETGEERVLTTDGMQDYEYGTSPDAVSAKVLFENLGVTTIPPMLMWSHDSTKFVTHRLDQRGVELMHIVRSAPLDGGRPKVMSYHYPMVGDEVLPTSDLFVFDAATGERTAAKCESLLTPFVPTIGYGFLWWSKADDKVFWLWGDRGDKTCRLHEMNPSTGDVEVRYEESHATHVLYGPQQQDNNIRVLATGEIVWWSQRTDWAHLYLVSTDGTEKALTSGDWYVRKVAIVDEENRRVVFAGAGRELGSDLYIQAIYSVDLDSGEISKVTDDDLDHEFTPSPTHNYFVDNTARYDTPNVAVLRDRSGAVVMELEQADASRLYEAGWNPPERVVVKSADGVTDIYCEIYKPFDFDETKKYPVIDEIYAGVQISTTAQRFPLSGGTLTGARNQPPFLSLGFAVVAVDHRGSACREKSFQDHNRLVADGDYVFDHVAAIQQLAETRPWMDLDRVGIFGHSGGGLGSTRCILAAPDFFKVAVSSAGDHDDAIYHAWWGEKFFGLKDEFDYDSHKNAALAANLKGKLLLVHGDMDDNVTPHHTMRLVDALIKENRNFDLLIVPNAEHTMMINNSYWVRRRWDYFVEHLMGETPPEYAIAPIPMDPEALAAMFGR